VTRPRPRIRCCFRRLRSDGAPGKQRPAGFISASVDPKIETLNSGAVNSPGWIRGPECGGRSPWCGAGALCQISRSQEDGTTRTKDLQVSSDQANRRGGMLVRSAGADCVHAAEAVCVTYGGQPWVWTSPKRGPGLLRREVRWPPREVAGCQPGLTIAELRSVHLSSGRRDRSPSLQGKPWETAPEPKLGCYCRSTRRPKLPESTLGVMRRHADQVCVVDARGRPAGKGDLVGETGNPRVGARARPEGKTASVTIAGRTGDLLF